MENKNVFYEDFGAKGDGVTDDFLAFKAAHEYANKNHLPVKAREGAIYYLHNTIVDGVVSYIEVQTDVDWTGAEIIIDDSDIDYYDGTRMATTHMFLVTSDYEKKILTLENEEDYEKITEGDDIYIENFAAAVSGDSRAVLVDKTNGNKIPLVLTLTERQRKILSAGGLLNYTKNGN